MTLLVVKLPLTYTRKVMKLQRFRAVGTVERTTQVDDPLGPPPSVFLVVPFVTAAFTEELTFERLST